MQGGPDGGYSLPVAEGDVVFITKPASYAVPLDKDNLPRFHYVHDPDGTLAELDYLRDDVVAEPIGTDAAFGITAGDVLYDDLTLFPRHNGIIGRNLRGLAKSRSMP